MYKENYCVEYHDVDMFGHMKLDTFFIRFMELANKDVYALGLYDKSMEGKYGFVLLKQVIEFNEPILLDDNIEIETNPCKMMHYLYPREYNIYKDGKQIVSSRSIWALMDLESRSIVSSTPDIALNLQKMKPVPSIKPSLDKVYLYTYTVEYNDIDVNGHMNNTIYIKLITNTIYQLQHNISIKQLNIQYKKECSYHDKIEIYYTHNKNTFIIEGINNHETSFLSKIICL